MMTPLDQYVVLTIKQLTSIHMQKYLFLGITCFIIASSNSPLSADSFNANEASTSIAHKHDYIGILEEKIHDLIMRGYSAEEIIAMFSDNHGHFRNNQELISKIYELLNKQNSKDNGVNIILNNKESEEFYAQMNSLTKMKKRILIVKIIIATGVTAVLLYLLYRLLKSIDDDRLEPELDNQHSNVVMTANPQAELVVRVEALQQNTVNSRPEFGGNALLHNENQNLLSAAIENLIPASEELVRNAEETNHLPIFSNLFFLPWNQNPDLPRVYIDPFNHRLSGELELQLQGVRRIIGNDPVEIQLNAANEELIDNRVISDELITEQIEYARRIGIEVAEDNNETTLQRHSRLIIPIMREYYRSVPPHVRFQDIGSLYPVAYHS